MGSRGLRVLTSDKLISDGYALTCIAFTRYQFLSTSSDLLYIKQYVMGLRAGRRGPDR